jgi:hypothetical protein
MTGCGSYSAVGVMGGGATVAAARATRAAARATAAARLIDGFRGRGVALKRFLWRASLVGFVRSVSGEVTP